MLENVPNRDQRAFLNKNKQNKQNKQIMKRTTLLTLCMLAFVGLSLNVNATVLRVNSSPGSSASYSTIQAAHNASSNNDTLYLEASPFGYGNLTASKKLTIIGSGYFLPQNPQTQAINSASTIGYIYFNAGSAGTKVTGCTIGYLVISVSDILLNRNNITSNGSYGIQTYASVGNLIITQNYINAPYASYYALYFQYPTSNVLISNNYIMGYMSSTAEFSGIVTNNVISGYSALYNTTYKNNIFSGYIYDYNCSFSYNLCDGVQLPATNNNQPNVAWANIFVGATGNSTDGQWKLKPGSPALGAGESGVDCGMYGGAQPYILSGMPNIPAIYYFNAPSVPSSTINVSIKAKSHN
jgi:hypothetical protein